MQKLHSSLLFPANMVDVVNKFIQNMRKYGIRSFRIFGSIIIGISKQDTAA